MEPWTHQVNQAAVAVDAAEALLGHQHSRGGPSQAHRRVPTARDVPRGPCDHGVRGSHDVRRGQRLAQFLRQPRADERQHLGHALPERPRRFGEDVVVLRRQVLERHHGNGVAFLLASPSTGTFPGAGQEGFEPAQEGLEVELSEPHRHGEADEGRKAVSDSATKKDSQSESGTSEGINRLEGKIDNRFDRLDSRVDSSTNRLDGKLDGKLDNSFNALLTEVRELGRKFDNHASAKDREERENSKDKRKEEREDESGRIGFWRCLGIAVVGGIVVVIGDYIKDNGFPGFN